MSQITPSSPVEWFNRQRQQLVDIRAVLRKESSTSTLDCLRKRQDLVEKTWSCFLNSYVDVVLQRTQVISPVDLSLARNTAAKVYADNKDILETALKIHKPQKRPNTNTNQIPQEQDIKSEIGYQIEDHLLNILGIPKMNSFDMVHLREIIDMVEFHSRMVERIAEVPTCPMLLCVTVSLKLDDETYSQWKVVEDTSVPPNILSLLSFLEQRWADAFREQQEDTKPDVTAQDQPNEEFPSSGSYRDARGRTHFERAVLFCRCCRKPGHRIGICWRFQRMTLRQRVRFLEKARMCANCFGDGLDGHDIDHCTSRRTCFNCGEKHHVLMCYYREEERQQHQRDDVRQQYRQEYNRQPQQWEQFDEGYQGYYCQGNNNYQYYN